MICLQKITRLVAHGLARCLKDVLNFMPPDIGLQPRRTRPAGFTSQPRALPVSPLCGGPSYAETSGAGRVGSAAGAGQRARGGGAVLYGCVAGAGSVGAVTVEGGLQELVEEAVVGLLTVESCSDVLALRHGIAGAGPQRACADGKGVQRACAARV